MSETKTYAWPAAADSSHVPRAAPSQPGLLNLLAKRAGSERQLLTTAELSARWEGQVSVEGLRRMRIAGKGPRWERLGGRVVYDLGAVIEYESSILAGGAQ
jgi:hypothetical protein